MKIQKMSAILDSDLEALLLKIGELHDIKAGKRKCTICRKTLALENIAAIFPISGQVKYCCSEQSCLALYNANNKELLNG